MTAEGKTWERDDNEFEKPVALPASKFAEAKDLLRWTLDQEKQERQAAKQERQAAKAVAAQASAAT